jgi:RNA polymerase sigma-70 factor (ECF subfamily)
VEQSTVPEDSNRFDEDERRWASWMRQGQRGDTGAYTRLLTEVAGAIEAFVRHRFGEIEMLEDCVQECLMSIHQARHTYDPARAFRPWLFTLVRHRTIDLLRRGNTWHRLHREAAAPAGDLDDHQERLDRVIDGAQALASLPDDHREAVILVKYQGLTTAEAATQLGIGESALKARLRRGLKTMFRALDREQADS